MTTTLTHDFGPPQHRNSLDSAAPTSSTPTPARPWRKYLQDALFALILIVAVVFGIGTYFTQRFTVESGSMAPTMNVGETFWSTKILEDPSRGEVVVFPNPANEAESVIKRVVGLPGERIEAIDGIVHINLGELDESVWSGLTLQTEDFAPITLGAGEYFMLGDNRDESLDSRYFGPIHIEDIEYKVHVNP